MSTEPENLLALIGAQMDAAMSKLEVRLIDRFAGKKDLENLEGRVDKLEQGRDGASAIAGMSWKLVTLAVAVLGAVATILWLYHG